MGYPESSQEALNKAKRPAEAGRFVDLDRGLAQGLPPLRFTFSQSRPTLSCLSAWTVSLPLPHSTRSTAVSRESMVSLPAPPLNVSLPAPPFSLSLPFWPWIWSAPAEPCRLSLPLPPPM